MILQFYLQRWLAWEGRKAKYKPGYGSNAPPLWWDHQCVLNLLCMEELQATFTRSLMHERRLHQPAGCKYTCHAGIALTPIPASVGETQMMHQISMRSGEGSEQELKPVTEPKTLWICKSGTHFSSHSLLFSSSWVITQPRRTMAWSGNVTWVSPWLILISISYKYWVPALAELVWTKFQHIVQSRINCLRRMTILSIVLLAKTDLKPK